eukprot:GEMP01000582.1.p1 GENE.GEMP01000582.1~~GEMP01000582.1.p1  ORF type:complete len:1461 (+),score=269.10 GEMP01000582.1:890-5272(+)
MFDAKNRETPQAAIPTVATVRAPEASLSCLPSDALVSSQQLGPRKFHRHTYSNTCSHQISPPIQRLSLPPLKLMSRDESESESSPVRHRQVSPRGAFSPLASSRSPRESCSLSDITLNQQVSDGGGALTTWRCRLWRNRLYRVLWGRDHIGVCVEILLHLLALLNFTAFSINIDDKFEDGECVLEFSENIRNCVYKYCFQVSLPIFSAIFLLRLACVAEHPHWRDETLSWWHYLSGSWLAWVEAIGLILGYIDYLVVSVEFPNFLWIRVMLLCDVFIRSNVGAFGISGLAPVIHGAKHLLLLFWIGAAVPWIAISIFYWLTERQNDEFVWRNGPGWKYNRMESIPSAMFFSSLNMVALEHPLADLHTDVAGRICVFFGFLMGVFLFSIPTGIFGSSFRGCVTKKHPSVQGLRESLELRELANEPSDDEKTNHSIDSDFLDHAATASNSNQSTSSPTRSVAEKECGMLELQPMSAEPLLGAILDKERENGAETKGVMKEKMVKTRADNRRSSCTSVHEGRKMIRKFAKIVKTRKLKYCCSIVAIVSIVSFIVATETPLGEDMPLWAFVVEVSAGSFFLMELLLRLYAAPAHRLQRSRLGYLLTGHGFIDLISAIPTIFIIGYYVTGFSSSFACQVAQAFAVTRILKVDRYIRSYGTMRDIVVENIGVISVTGFGLLVLWVMLSIIMHYLERRSYDLDQRGHYYSITMSMWGMLLALTGEVPWCEYTPEGRAVLVVVLLIASSAMSINLSILGNGFHERLRDKTRRPNLRRIREDSTFSMSTDFERSNTGNLPTAWEKNRTLSYLLPIDTNKLSNRTHGCFCRFCCCLFCGLDRKLMRKRVYDFFYKQETPFPTMFKYLVISCVALSITTESVLTTPDFKSHAAHLACCVVDAGCAVVFVLMYVINIIASPGYMISPLGLIDLASLIKYAALQTCQMNFYYANSTYWTTCPCIVVMPPGFLRLFLLDSYIPSVSVIARVIVRNRVALVYAYFALLPLWLVMATVLFLFEERDEELDDELLYPMRVQYASVGRALKLTLVHLTGDYPITTYTFYARVLHFFIMTACNAVTQLPAAIFACSFSEELKSKREAERLPHKRARAARVIQRAWRKQGLVSSRFADVVLAKMLQKNKDTKHLVENEEHRGIGLRVKRLLYADTSIGNIYRSFEQCMLIIQVLTGMALSTPEVEDYLTVNTHAGVVFGVFAFVIMLQLLSQYVLRVIASGVMAKYRCSRWRCVFSFPRLLDLLCICCLVNFPCMLVLSKSPTTYLELTVVGLTLRVIFVYEWPMFQGLSKLLRTVWHDVRETIAGSLLLALIVWLLGSVGFYYSERYGCHISKANDDIAIKTFASIPSSMYFSFIFLLGEWVYIDFSLMGSIFCCLYCLCGMTIFAVPLGSIFESVGNFVELGNRRLLASKEFSRNGVPTLRKLMTTDWSEENGDKGTAVHGEKKVRFHWTVEIESRKL